jgi:holliday junction DNA helicase RuvA
MIGKLKGVVDSCLPDHAIIDVGGVGYLVYCPVSTLNKLTQNTPCSLYITTHVREDHIHLYGFFTIQEKEYFALLQSVSGIGARMALGILSVLRPEQIAIAIMQRDKNAFKSASGVGTKLAERILIELKDKIKTNIGLSEIHSGSHTLDNDKAQDGVSALVYLGINRQVAENVIHKILAANPDIKTDELIKLALKERGT